MRMQTKHTTMRLSDEGRARLHRLGEVYADRTAAMEAAIELLFNRHFHPTSGAGDAVLDKVRRHIAAALQTITGELERRAELDDDDD